MIRLAKHLLAVALAGTTAQAAELDVTVSEIRSQQGVLMIALVDSAAAWDDHAEAVASAVRKAPGAQETFHFSNLPAGTYAVKVMHDENGNGKLDANFMGMPTEGYGFSNNPTVLRKPTFDEAKFDLGAAAGSITLRLR